MKRDLLKKVTGLALVGALAFAGLNSAYADEAPDNAPKNITKFLDLTEDKGAVVPKVDFTFTVEAMDPSDMTQDAPYKLGNKNDANTKTDVWITQKDEKFLKNPAEGQYKISFNASNDYTLRGDKLEQVAFEYGTLPTKAGVYGYKVTEQASTATGIANDTKNERVLLFFINNAEGGGTKLDSVIQIDPTSPTGKTGATDPKSDPKYNNLSDTDKAKLSAGDVIYDNTYTTHSLTIKKEIAGNYGDQTKTFNITTSLQGNDWAENFPVKDTDDVAKPKTQGAKNSEVKKALKHNETYTLTGLPSDVKFTVLEDETDRTGYNVKYYDVAKDGNRTEITDLETVAKELGDEDKTILVENTSKNNVDASNLGVINTILPFLVVIALAILAGRIYFKKNEEERA